MVPIADAGVDPETNMPYLVMDLMEGVDLGQCIERVGCMQPTVAVRIVHQAAKGLRAAHAVDVIHRDVKPANLFLARVGGGGLQVRVVDFGVAKALSCVGITNTGSTLGTPLYMAPEQLRDAKRVGPEVDVCALGMTLYEALAGHAPHVSQRSIPELVEAVLMADTPPLQDYAPWIDPSLATIVHGALVRDRSARCPSMVAFVKALEPFAGECHELTEAMLQPLPDDVRDQHAERARLPARWAGRLPSIPTPIVNEGEPVIIVSDWGMASDDDLALERTVDASRSDGSPDQESRAPHRSANRPVGVWILVLVAVGIAAATVWYFASG